MMVWRVQDSEGRGPFKPGTTEAWADVDGPDLPTVLDEFGASWLSEIPRGWHAGCACLDLDQVARWFSPTECGRLAQLGYRLVTIDRCFALRGSRHQMIVIRERPFARGAIARPWPHMDATARLHPWREMAHAEEMQDE